MTLYHFPIDDSEIILKCLLMRPIRESSGGSDTFITFTANFRCFPLQVGGSGHMTRTFGKANYLLFLTWVLYRGGYLSKWKIIHSHFVVSTTVFVLPEIVLKVANKITTTYRSS